MTPRLTTLTNRHSHVATPRHGFFRSERGIRTHFCEGEFQNCRHTLFRAEDASRLSERAALQATPLPRVTTRPHLSACVFRLSVLEDNTDNRDNGLILNTMLSDDNNKYNFYQPKGWLPLEICCPSCLCCLPKTARELLSKRTIVFVE